LYHTSTSHSDNTHIFLSLNYLDIICWFTTCNYSHHSYTYTHRWFTHPMIYRKHHEVLSIFSLSGFCLPYYWRVRNCPKIVRGTPRCKAPIRLYIFGLRDPSRICTSCHCWLWGLKWVVIKLKYLYEDYVWKEILYIANLSYLILSRRKL